jgi:transposase
VIFYSRDYDKRAKAEREPAVQKARDLIGNPSKYNRATSLGAAKYVKNLTYDPKTGEILTTKSKPVFDEAKLREEEKYDGYYAIVSSELDKTDEEIIEIYKGLWRIEESFRVTKSDLATRPVYLERQDRIAAHFMICFIALLIARLIQNRLDNKYTVATIAESLNKTCCTHIGKNLFAFDHADNVLEAVRDKLSIDLTLRYQTLGHMKKILSDVKSQ